MNIKRVNFLGILLLLIVFAVSLLIYLTPKKVFATSGCCSWHGGVAYCDTSVGTYVCNDGSYSPTCGCLYVPPVPKFPDMRANWKWNPNPNGTYDLNVSLEDINPSSYSVTLSKYAGGDPGPLVDYITPKFVFTGVTEGRWYMNVKKSINNRWSNNVYYTIDIPAWVSPTPIPTEAPILIDSSNDKPFIEKLYDWLFGWLANKNSTALAPTPIPIPTDSPEPFICDCSKTCTQISSCSEAYYQLNTCGCSMRDGDGDGVPCENLCR